MQLLNPLEIIRSLHLNKKLKKLKTRNMDFLDPKYPEGFTNDISLDLKLSLKNF